MEQLHFIIVSLVIIAIIFAQIYVYKNTKKKLKSFKSIFPSGDVAYSISEIEIQEDGLVEMVEEALFIAEPIKVSQIKINTDNSTLEEIIKALNMYLQKNKGAASDFYLMKDVVERYCDAEEEEINIQQPIPLYLGLMGTMVGIIVGIGFIAMAGGLSSDSLMSNITSLMTCVAIAMASSLVGILCTTLISWRSKSATSKVEADKNRFYSWLQTELLPLLSGNAVNTLYLLQQNLATFNRTFESNIEGLDFALSKISDSSKEQIELISLIKDIDIKRVAQANVTVLKELKECTNEISFFNKYLHSVSDYLTRVNELNTNVNEHLNRTAAIERMGVFFEREIEQVSTRERYINEVVANVDNTLRKSFEAIAESTANSVSELRNNSIAEFDALLKHYENQKNEFSRMLQEQNEDMIKRNEDLTEFIREIRSLADIKNTMSDLVESTKKQTSILEKIVDSLKHQKNVVHSPNEVSSDNLEALKFPTFPKSIIIMMSIITFLVFIALGIYIYNFLLSNNIINNLISA
jgi:biopolymer transport protein ExbB/TolQ